MFLSLLNKKEMLKFLDLAIYMVDIDGEPTQYEKRILNKMIAELDEIKDEYSFRLTDSVCLLYTSPSPRDAMESSMPSSA